MPLFSSTVAAHLAQRTVAPGMLVFMDFESAPKRWWMGNYTLTTGGHDWQGVGSLISVSAVPAPIGTTAQPVTFTMSGVNAEIVTLCRQADSRVRDRSVIIYLTFFEHAETDGGMQWQPLDSPVAIWSGKMGSPKYQASGPSARTVSLTAENLWSGKRVPPFGLYTPRDQEARYPGDKGLRQMPGPDKTIFWPVV